MAVDPAQEALISGRVLRSTAANYLGQFITLATGFVLTPFILNHLGATDYGLWVLVGSVVAYGALLDIGIWGAVVKYVSEYMARREVSEARSLVATSVWLYCGLGLLAVVLGAIIAPVFPDLFNVPPGDRATASWLVFVSGLALGISLPATVGSAVLRGLHRFDLSNLISITATLLVAGATVFALLMGWGVLGIVAVNIPLTLLMQIPTIWLINRIAPDLQFGWAGARRSSVRTVFSFSSSLFLSQIGGRLETKTDEIVIGSYLPVSSVTPYSIARRLSEMSFLLTSQFSKVLLPLASEMHASNEHQRLRSLYLTSTRLTLAIFVPLGCIFIILARQILAAWVGAQYSAQAHLVVILTLASLTSISLYPAGSVLQGAARHRPLAIISLCSGITNLVLSLVLVRIFGVTGVALGTLIPTTFFNLGFAFPYALRVIGIKPLQLLEEAVAPALLPGVPTAILLYLFAATMDLSSWLSIATVALTACLVYAIGYLIFGSSDFEKQTYKSLALGTLRGARLLLRRP